MPGQTVVLDLSGFAANDAVRIRWRVDGVWVQVGTAITNVLGGLTGVAVVVPADANAGPTAIRVDGTINQQTNSVTVLAPAVSVSQVSGTVGNKIGFEVVDYPPNSPVSISWRRLSGSIIDLGSVTADGSGAASGEITVPATPGGAGQVVTFASGSVTQQVSLEVKPRIRVTPSPAVHGARVDISLRGFARQEVVVIRWRLGTSGPFQTIASGRTSNTGSANITFAIPVSAVDGTYQVRAESASFNQQTNVFAVQGAVQLADSSEHGAPSIVASIPENPINRPPPEPAPGIDDPVPGKPEEGEEPEAPPEDDDPPDDR
jgi:hypothetical protein